MMKGSGSARRRGGLWRLSEAIRDLSWESRAPADWFRLAPHRFDGKGDRYDQQNRNEPVEALAYQTWPLTAA